MSGRVSHTALAGFAILALRTLVHEDCPASCLTATCPAGSQLVNVSTPGCCRCAVLDPASVPPNCTVAITDRRLAETFTPHPDAGGCRGYEIHATYITRESCEASCLFQTDWQCLGYSFDSDQDASQKCRLYSDLTGSTHGGPENQQCYMRDYVTNTTGGCPCGPGAPLFTRQVSACSEVDTTVTCHEAFQGSVANGTGIPCRVVNGSACVADGGCSLPVTEPEPEPESGSDSVGGSELGGVPPNCTAIVDRQYLDTYTPSPTAGECEGVFAGYVVHADTATLCADACSLHIDCAGYMFNPSGAGAYEQCLQYDSGQSPYSRPEDLTNTTCYYRDIAVSVVGGCPCGTGAPRFTRQVTACSEVDTTVTCREAFQGSVADGTGIPCRVVNGSVCVAEGGCSLPVTEPEPEPESGSDGVGGPEPGPEPEPEPEPGSGATPGLGDCPGGCECGPDAPILTLSVASCEDVNALGQVELIDAFCTQSFEGDVAGGTGVPCERLYDAATGGITCTTGNGTCIVPEPDCSTRTEDVIDYTGHPHGCAAGGGYTNYGGSSDQLCRSGCDEDPNCTAYQLVQGNACLRYTGEITPLTQGGDPECFEKVVSTETVGGCPCGPTAPVYTTLVADCAALTDTDACRESYQGDPTTGAAVPCRLGPGASDQVCGTGPGHCTATSGPVPTPGLEACRGSGCVCGPTEPMLFNHVDDCTAIVDNDGFHIGFHIVCQSSYQGSLENGTAVICERVLHDGGYTTCRAAPETPCLAEPPCDSDEASACALDPCDNYALNTHAIDGSCCQCPAAGFDAVEDPVSHDNITGYTRMKLVYDLPPGYTLGFVGGGFHLGLSTTLVAPAAFQVAAPFGSTFGPPTTESVDLMPIAAYDSYVTVGDYTTFNGTANPDQWFLFDTDNSIDWDQNGGILYSSTDAMSAQEYPNGPWNTGSSTVVFQLTISKAESYDPGCGPGGAPCATALIGGVIDPLGASPVTNVISHGADGLWYLTGVQWVRQVTWHW